MEDNIGYNFTYVDGIAGFNGNVPLGSFEQSSRGTIINAENHAHVSAGDYFYAGGIVGFNTFDI